MLLVFAGKCKCKWPVVPDRIWGAGSDGKGCQILTWQPWWTRLLCRMSQPPESSTEPRHSSLCRLFEKLAYQERDDWCGVCTPRCKTGSTHTVGTVQGSGSALYLFQKEHGVGIDRRITLKHGWLSSLILLMFSMEERV